jgi:DNA-nicking Smr family endonuclease
MRRPRHLSPEERELWSLVARQAKPLSPAAPRAPAKPPAPKTDSVPAQIPVSAPPQNFIANPLPDFRVGQKVDHSRTHDLIPGLAEQMGKAPVRMDAKSFGKLKKGKLHPEARIDLHGMTLSEAHPALTGFILSSHARGLRLVLVITGKGKLTDYEAPMPVRHGVLRHQVPQWLNLMPLRPLILQVTPAHISHGGQGAYYVYLRRGR